MEDGFSFIVSHRGHVALISVKVFEGGDEWMDWIENTRGLIEEEFIKTVDVILGDELELAYE